MASNKRPRDATAETGGRNGGGLGTGNGDGANGDDLNIVALKDSGAWEKVERICTKAAVYEAIPHLRAREMALEKMNPAERHTFSKSDLGEILRWKHSVGKNRIFNVKCTSVQ